MRKIKLLMVGPSPQVMGGISAVVNNYIDSELPQLVDLKYLTTHIDGNKLAKIYTALKAYLKFPFLCAAFRPDLVHIHFSTYFSFYRKIVIFTMTKIFKIRVCIHLHGAQFMDFYQSSRIHGFFVRAVCNHSDVVIALSESWKKWVTSICHNQKIFVLYNPVNISDYLEIKPWQQQSNFKNILFMGIIGNRKGVYDIIKIIPEVAKIYPEARFIFGGNGEIEKAKRLCKNAGVLDRADFPGWVGPNTKIKYYSEACIYLLPAYTEGLPVSILEAMAAGLPVITTPVGGISEIVEDGINGCLIQPGDIEAMKEKLLLLLGSRQLREKIGRANKLKAEEKFDIKIIVKKLFDIYKLYVLTEVTR